MNRPLVGPRVFTNEVSWFISYTKPAIERKKNRFQFDMLVQQRAFPGDKGISVHTVTSTRTPILGFSLYFCSPSCHSSARYCPSSSRVNDEMRIRKRVAHLPRRCQLVAPQRSIACLLDPCKNARPKSSTQIEPMSPARVTVSGTSVP